jgi:predicted MFS family arabinose efflux permease
VLAAVPLVRRSLTADLHLSGAGRSHGSLLASTLRLARTSPVLVQSAVMQFFVFATFNLFWSSMVLHLTGGDYGWSVLGAGLFSLVGLAAGFATTQGGRFIDRFGPLRFAGVLFVVLLTATASAIVDSDRVWLFGVTIFVVTLANQLIRALAATPGATAGANTLFMVGMFLGGATGATVGPLAFTAGGVPLVASVGVGFVTVAAAVWVLAWFTDPGRVSSTGSLPLPQNP